MLLLFQSARDCHLERLKQSICALQVYGLEDFRH